MVQLVRELVQDQVPSIFYTRGSGPGILPRKDDGAALPGLAETLLVSLDGETAGGLFLDRSRVRLGVYEDRRESRIVVGLAVEQEKAGVGSDGDLDFVGDLEARASLEPFLRKEHLNVSL